MNGDLVMIWKAGPAVKLTADEIARELLWGEEVDGLVDLPVKEIIGRLKAEFPRHDEQPGVLVGQGNLGRFEATWTWQHIRLELRDLPPDDRQRLREIASFFGCTFFERQTG